MVMRAGLGPKAKFTPEQLALFAQYRRHREAARPAQCTYCEDRCWVEQGPPAINGNRRCVACNGAPVPLEDDA